MIENWKQPVASVIGGILVLFSKVPLAEVVGVLSILAGTALTIANIRIKLLEAKKLELEIKDHEDGNKG